MHKHVASPRKKQSRLWSVWLLAAMLQTGPLFASGLPMGDNQAVETTLNNILSFLNANGANNSMNQYLQALINYDAAARLNALQYDQELLFMAAPGSAWAVSKGAIVANVHQSSETLLLHNSSMLSAMTPFVRSTINNNATVANYSGPLSTGLQNGTLATLMPSNIFDTYFSSLIAGSNGGTDTTNLLFVAPGYFLQTNNVNTPLSSSGGNTVTLAPYSQLMINLMTNPVATLSRDVLLAIQDAQNNGSNATISNKELLTSSLTGYAVASLSMNAMSDIVSRRTPANGQSESLMQVMDEYSAIRFTNPAWYTQMSAASDTAILREIAHILAYNSWLQYQQFRVQEQQMALLASMNSVMAKMNVAIDSLSSQMASAAAQTAGSSSSGTVN